MAPPLIEGDGDDGTSDGSDGTSTSPGTGMAMPGPGCVVEGRSYMDGMQLPRNASRPCELCYCLRGHEACMEQKCQLNVDGCAPIYQVNKLFVFNLRLAGITYLRVCPLAGWRVLPRQVQVRQELHAPWPRVRRR